MRPFRITLAITFAGIVSGTVAAQPPADAAPATQPGGFTGEVAIVLETALPHHSGTPQPLVVHATIEAGRWTDTWGQALTYNKMVHEVEVDNASVTDRQITFNAAVRVRPDMWVPGGRATYRVTVERTPHAGAVYSEHATLRTAAATEVLSGTFTGRFTRGENETRVGGVATGVVWPPRDVAGPGFEPIDYDTRPRLLLREADLPTLRARLDTPAGKAIRARLEAMTGDEIALGLLYQLTRDHQYARAAHPITMANINAPRRTEEHETHQATYWGDRLTRAASAYDLCFYGWTDEQRAEVEAFLNHVGINEALFRPHTFGSAPVLAHGADKADKVYAGGAIAALALWGVDGPPPSQPRTVTDPRLAKLADRFSEAEDRAAAIIEYERQLARWEMHEHANLKYLDASAYGRRLLYLSTLHAVGEGGWGGHPNVWTYAQAYRNSFGRSVTGRPILTHAAAALVARTYWADAPADDKAGLPAGPRARTVRGGAFVDGDHLTRLLAFSPPPWRAALLWHALRQAGLPDDALTTEAGTTAFLTRSRITEPASLLRLLQYLPDPPVPQNPSAAVPKTWRDLTEGRYVFRNGWAGDDTIIAQFHAAEPRRGGAKAHDTGTFLIYGLGHRWAVDDRYYRGGQQSRQMFNAVMLGDSPKTRGAGPVTSYTADPATGAASITIDLADVYRDSKTVTDERIETVREGRITKQRPVTVERTADRYPQAAGLRAFAVDYSGESGAPAVFAVVDRIRIEDGRPVVWAMHVDQLVPDHKARRRGVRPTDVKIDGNTFVVTRGDATLRGVFIMPVGVRLEAVRSGSHYVWIDRGGKYSKWEHLPRRRLEATTADGHPDAFFVVMTLQRGDAPPITVDGEGLDAVVRVGGQTVRFDGKRITIGGDDE